MNKLILIFMASLILSCKSNEPFSSENINRVEISKEIGFNASNEIKNKKIIKNIVGILNTGKKEPVKFYPKYYIRLNDISGKVITILVRDNYYKLESKTHSLDKNLEKYIDKLFEITKE
jgi:hypothetical protein